MPLRPQLYVGSPETAGHSTSFQTLSLVVGQRFLRRFEVPRDTPVDGIVFNNLGTINGTLKEKNLVPALQEVGYDPRTRSALRRPVEIDLPPIFEPGTMTLAHGNPNDNNHYQIVLQFNGLPSSLIVHYETHPFKYESVFQALSQAAILAALPRGVIESAPPFHQQPLAVITQGIPAEDKYIGYNGYSTVLMLHKSNFGVVEARGVYTNQMLHGEDQNAANIRVQTQAVQRASRVFFLLDGYFP